MKDAKEVRDVYKFHLTRAEYHAQEAITALYGPGRLKRGWWYRRRLLRAQNALMGLIVSEMKVMTKEFRKKEVV